MELQWVVITDSTLVKRIAYDAASEQIHVQLRTGATNLYEDCPQELWEAFLKAESKGTFLKCALPSHAFTDRLPPRPAAEGEVSAILNAFHPARPITDPQFFSGRRQQIEDLAKALQIPGSCPLIYGDRGLGKSSLASQAQLIAMGDRTLLISLGLEAFALTPQQSFTTVLMQCSEGVDDLDTLVQTTLNAVADLVPTPSSDQSDKMVLSDRKTRKKASFKVLELETTRTYSHSRSEQTLQRLTPVEQLRRSVSTLTEFTRQPLLLILDEFDTLQDKRGVASMIKTISSEFVKFMLVGIAQDWSDLLLDHASLERQIMPVLVPPMTRPEAAGIIGRAMDALKEAGIDLTFGDEAAKRLVDLAGGFPWFVHVIGQTALIESWEAREPVVSGDRVIRTSRALARSRYAQQFAHLYQQAVQGSRNRELVLRHFAKVTEQDIRTATEYPKLVKSGVTNPAVYVGHLTSERYGAALYRPASQDRGLLRFRNAMFRQYIRISSPLFGH